MTERVNISERIAQVFHTASIPRKRRRPALSCEQCRRRKIKCDRSGPSCLQCRQSKYTTCTYTPQPQKASKSGTDLVYPDSRDLTVNTQQQPSVTNSTIQSPSSSNVFDTATIASSWSSPAADRRSDTSSNNAQALVNRVQRLEQLLAKSTSEVEKLRKAPPASDSGVPKDLRGTLSKTRFFGASNWMHSFGRFDSLVCVKQPSVVNGPTLNDEFATGEVMTLLEQCKTIGRAGKQEVHQSYLLNPEPESLVPSRRLSDALIHLYFRTSESHYRILHFPSFNREYLQYWEQPSNASQSFILKMLLALAVASPYYQGLDVAEVRLLAKKWIFAGSQWLTVTPSEKGRLNISGLQIHCLVVLARHIVGIVGDLIWISAGSLVRAAFNMGFHRDPRVYPKMSPLHAELRRRLWATILEINVQFSLDSGMNPLLRMEDFDTGSPANINDIDIDETTKVEPIPHPSNVYTQTTVQLLLLRSLPLRLRICRMINDIRSEPTYDEALDLGTEITKACKENTSHIQGAQISDPTVHITQLQRNLLDQMTRRFLVAIHRGFAIKAYADPRFYFSRKVCLDAAMTMSSYPTDETGTIMAPLDQEPRDEFTMYKICGAGYFKSVMLHSALIIFQELYQQLEEDADISEAGFRSREPLKRILRQTIDLTAQKIGLSENNVKGHIFMSAILGQIEATENRESHEAGALEAAKKSAKLCLELMTARTPSFFATLNSDTQPKDTNTQPKDNTTEWRVGLASDPMTSGAELGEFGMQDWNMDFEVPDSWLFSGWEENRCW